MNLLKVAILSLLIIWGIGYFLCCLVFYELLNPIQYIINWPEWSIDDRAVHLIGFGLLWLVVSAPIRLYLNLTDR